MSFDHPDLQSAWIFMDLPEARAVFPDEKCIDPSLVNLLPQDSSTSSSFPLAELASEMASNSPPPSISSNADDVEQLMSPISRRASVDWPPAESRAAMTKHSSTRIASRRNSVSAEKPKPAGRRVPHNIVEQKYRNTLNAEIERLRGAIPHLACLGDGSADRSTKPSKACVLASAVDYIRGLEAECQRLKRKNAELQKAAKVS